MSILPWSKKSPKGPITASEILAQSNSLAPVASGEMAGYPFNYMVNAEGGTFVMIDLKKDTGFHLIAFGGKSSLKSSVRRDSLEGLIRIDLGNDIKKNVAVYGSPEQAQKILESFKSLEMSYFADFCQNYNFELYRQDVYITLPVVTTDSEKGSPALPEIEDFMKHNTKWLEVILKPKP
jgi:hypothetical protein